MHIPFPRDVLDEFPNLNKTWVSLRLIDSGSTIAESSFDPNRMCVVASDRQTASSSSATGDDILRRTRRKTTGTISSSGADTYVNTPLFNNR